MKTKWKRTCGQHLYAVKFLFDVISIREQRTFYLLSRSVRFDSTVAVIAERLGKGGRRALGPEGPKLILKSEIFSLHPFFHSVPPSTLILDSINADLVTSIKPNERKLSVWAITFVAHDSTQKFLSHGETHSYYFDNLGLLLSTKKGLVIRQ